MKITILGASGSLGLECLKQAIQAGHEITILVRDPQKIPAELRSRVELVQGDATKASDVARSIPEGTKAILFAIGLGKDSQANLCTTVTGHIIREMKARPSIERFIWCGAGSTFVEEDSITAGSWFVRLFAMLFMGKQHRDKENQYQLLENNRELDWMGVRPLQMKSGPLKKQYRLGFEGFSGLSSISFADCAHAMLGMLKDDTWIRKAPIIQY